MKPKILVVDDDPFTRRLFIDLLSDDKVELQTAVDLSTARQLLRANDYNLLILDQRLPDGNGLDLFAEVRRERPRQMAILITGFAEVRDAVRAVQDGLFDYRTKPFESLEELDAVIGKALEMDSAYREIADLRETLGSTPVNPLLIGRSALMEKQLAQVRQVAPLDATVLIEGESGTGKELIAKQIHALSRRAKKPMLEINCGALSESLLEATLFGYEKGAFTGAAKATPGYIEAADGGTLLLDEITDMSPKLQVSLLRVLQEQTFSRLGSTAQRSSDFRLICSTNKHLEAEVKAGRFRSDLFYRIKVVVLQAPNLRSRREDILPLALFYLDHFNRKFDKSAGPFAPSAITDLESFAWPGNVRELKHAVERAVITHRAGSITSADLGIGRRAVSEVASAEAAQPLPLQEARDNFEREYFSQLLKTTGGNISEASRLSGIARQNLYANLRRLGISPQQ